MLVQLPRRSEEQLRILDSVIQHCKRIKECTGITLGSADPLGSTRRLRCLLSLLLLSSSLDPPELTAGGGVIIFLSPGDPQLVDFSPNKGGTTGVGFLLTFYRITFVRQDFPPVAADLPRLA